MFIGVIGGRECSPEEAKLAKEVGRLIAEKKAILICGGLGGVMEAAARGAFLAGGLTIGILPGKNRQEANPYIKLPIVTNMGAARNLIIVLSSQAVIAIGGGYGTLSEIAFALQYGVPVIALNSWQLPENRIIQATSPSEAIEKAIQIITCSSQR